MADNGIERREATPQFISNFEVCENDSWVKSHKCAAFPAHSQPSPHYIPSVSNSAAFQPPARWMPGMKNCETKS